MELLGAIFECLINSLQDDPHQEDSYYRALYTLMGVSKRWQEAIKGTPELWVLIDCETPEHVWRAALDRSRALTLEVSLHLDNYNTSPHSHVLLGLALPHIARWDTAKLLIPLRDDISALEQHAAPHLTQFELSISAGGYYRGVDLFQGCAPQLRSLSLEDVALKSWSSPILFGLRQLKLSCVPEGLGPSLSQIMDILRGCPNLEGLCLNFVSLTSLRDRQSPPNETPITLPRLKTLHLREEETEHILFLLHLPFCTQYALVWDPFSNPDLGDVASAFGSSLVTAQSLDITVGPPRLQGIKLLSLGPTSSSTRDTLFLLQSPTRSLRHVMFTSGIVQIIENVVDRVVPIALTLASFGDLSLEDVAVILWRLPGVHSIHLDDMEDSEVRVMMGLLSSSQRAGGVHDCWLCPNLRSLRLTRTHPYEVETDLVRLAEERLKASEREGVKQEGSIVRLEELVLHGVCPTFRDGSSALWARVDSDLDE